MKKFLSIVCLLYQVVVYGQINTFVPSSYRGPDYSKTIFPKDGLIYDQFVGETIAGYTIANGWREDTINGGFNKIIHENPYLSYSKVFFKKEKGRDMKAYRYENGKLFTGQLIDTFSVYFETDKIIGYHERHPYYQHEFLNLEFVVDCVDGLLQGKGLVLAHVPQYGIYNKLPLSECYFEDGEIVGIHKNWNLNSVRYTIRDSEIHILEKEEDYFKLIQLLDFSEFTYVKGKANCIKYTIYKRDKKTGEMIAEEQQVY